MLVREAARGRGLAERSRGLIRCEDSSALLALPNARMPVGGRPPRSASDLHLQPGSDTSLFVQLSKTQHKFNYLRAPGECMNIIEQW